MKPIKCPNCGSKMTISRRGYEWVYSWTMCHECGVRGPEAGSGTIAGSARKAARLTREWIARMEADKDKIYDRGYRAGIDAANGRLP